MYGDCNLVFITKQADFNLKCMVFINKISFLLFSKASDFNAKEMASRNRIKVSCFSLSWSYQRTRFQQQTCGSLLKYSDTSKFYLGASASSCTCTCGFQSCVWNILLLLVWSASVSSHAEECSLTLERSSWQCRFICFLVRTLIKHS